MLLISSKLMGEIICGVCIALLVILVICAIVSKTPNNKDSKEVVKNNAEEKEVSAEEEAEETPEEKEVVEPAKEEEEVETEEETSEEPVEETDDEEQEEETEETPEEEEVVEPAEEEVETEEEASKEPVEETDDEEQEEETEETPEDEEVVEPAEEEVETEEETSEEPVEETNEEEQVEETEETKEESTDAVVAQPNARYAGKYVITMDETGYRFKLVASNGQSLIVSEAYTTEAGCRRGIDTIKRNVVAGQVKIDSDKHNLYFFTLVSKQNRILAQSASYKAKDSAVRASESFKKFALTDNIIVDEESKKSASTAEVVNIESEIKDGGEYTIEQDAHGYIYVLKASNGVKIVTSQDYSSLNAAKEAYERFKDAVYNGEWQIVKDKNSNYQFKLYLRRRLVVAGELYQSKDQVKSTIASIKSWAKNATYEEPNFENNQQ